MEKMTRMPNKKYLLPTFYPGEGGLRNAEALIFYMCGHAYVSDDKAVPALMKPDQDACLENHPWIEAMCDLCNLILESDRQIRRGISSFQPCSSVISQVDPNMCHAISSSTLTLIASQSRMISETCDLPRNLDIDMMEDLTDYMMSLGAVVATKIQEIDNIPCPLCRIIKQYHYYSYFIPCDQPDSPRLWIRRLHALYLEMLTMWINSKMIPDSAISAIREAANMIEFPSHWDKSAGEHRTFISQPDSYRTDENE